MTDRLPRPMRSCRKKNQSKKVLSGLLQFVKKVRLKRLLFRHRNVCAKVMKMKPETHETADYSGKTPALPGAIEGRGRKVFDSLKQSSRAAFSYADEGGNS